MSAGPSSNSGSGNGGSTQAPQSLKATIISAVVGVLAITLKPVIVTKLQLMDESTFNSLLIIVVGAVVTIAWGLLHDKFQTLTDQQTVDIKAHIQGVQPTEGGPASPSPSTKGT
jgi:hypothetical protein